MTDGPAADVAFGQLAHFNGRLDASDDADPLERVLKRERVHHGGEHTHVVG